MTRGGLCFIQCGLVFGLGVYASFVTAENRVRGAHLFGLELERLHQEQEIPHLRNSLEKLELEELAFESAFGDPQTRVD